MNLNNRQKATIIFIVYLIATLILLFFGYSVQKPEITRQEFPFTITYSYQGETNTISGIYAGEYVPKAKYLGDNSVGWYGYIQDQDRLQADFYRIGEIDSQKFSINLNIVPGYLMGDPAYAGSVCQPAGVYHSFDGMNDITVTDPAELEKLGLSIVGWEYPEPVENHFSFGGFSLSSEATLYTAVIAIAALLACMILIRKDKQIVVYGAMDKISIMLNFLIAIVVFPFIFMVSAISEILADTSIWQQILYLTPALTVLGIGASVTLRRMGCKRIGFWSQFAGPAVFALLTFIVNP